MLYHPQRASVTEAPDVPSHSKWPVVVGIVTLALILVLAIAIFLKHSAPEPTPEARPQATSASKVPIDDKAVLTIIASNDSGSYATQGSGFLLSADGLAATNYHVIRGTTEAIAECCDGKTFEIREIEGIDVERDVVLVQLFEKDNPFKPKSLPFLTLGDTTEASIGSRVVVIGSPRGLQNTVSDGVLSAIRDTEDSRVFQITAPISPGSSGGPVFDETGRVIGIATFQFTKGQNLNFAVSTDYLRPLLNQHLEVSLPEHEKQIARANRVDGVGTNGRTNMETSSQPSSAGKSATGEYVGFVHNQSVSLSAQFAIVVDENKGVLAGCMGVVKPLYGSGPVSGLIDGADVTFYVDGPVGLITFTGLLNKGSLNGTYTVSRSGVEDQTGTFSLHRTKLQGFGPDFDTSKCPSDEQMNQ